MSLMLDIDGELMTIEEARANPNVSVGQCTMTGMTMATWEVETEGEGWLYKSTFAQIVTPYEHDCNRTAKKFDILP